MNHEYRYHNNNYYAQLDPSCNKYCDLIGQKQVFISRKKLLPMIRIVARQQFIIMILSNLWAMLLGSKVVRHCFNNYCLLLPSCLCTVATVQQQAARKQLQYKQ